MTNIRQAAFTVKFGDHNYPVKCENTLVKIFSSSTPDWGMRYSNCDLKGGFYAID